MKLFILFMMIQTSAFAAISLELDGDVVAVKDQGSVHACASELAREALEYASNDFDHLKISNVKTTENKTTFEMVDRSGKLVYEGAMKLLREDGKCYLSQFLSLKNAETKTAEIEWEEKTLETSSIVDPLDPSKKYSF